MEPDTNQGQSLTEQVSALHKRLKELSVQGSSAEPVLVSELSTAYEELRVAEEELSAQQHELDRLVQLHSQGRASREQLIARLPVPVFLTDAHGAIESANAAAGTLLRTGLHRLVRKPLFAF